MTGWRTGPARLDWPEPMLTACAGARREALNVCETGERVRLGRTGHPSSSRAGHTAGGLAVRVGLALCAASLAIAAIGPTARYAAAMAFDPRRGETILFGGYGDGGW